MTNSHILFPNDFNFYIFTYMDRGMGVDDKTRTTTTRKKMARGTKAQIREELKERGQKNTSYKEAKWVL